MPGFHRVRFLNGADRPATFRLRLDGLQTREFGAHLDAGGSEIQTIDPPIDGLRVVSSQPNPPPCTRVEPMDAPPMRIGHDMPDGRPLKNDQFEEAIVWLESDPKGHMHGGVMAVTEQGLVFVEDLIP